MYPITSLPSILNVPISQPPPVISISSENTKSTDFDRPIVYVGNISDKIPDSLIKEILTKCGNIISWKRVQGASQPKAFGFCDFDNPEATLRCIRLLNDFKVADNVLKVKVDQKTEELLSEYKLKKKATIEEREANKSKSKEAITDTLNAIYKKELDEDKVTLETIKKIIFDSGYGESVDELPSHRSRRSDKEESNKINLDEFVADDETKFLITKEIESFRSKHKYDERIEKEERFKRIRERERDRYREKECDIERTREKGRKRRNRSRTNPEKVRKKAQEKESNYQAKLRVWEVREKKKLKERENQLEYKDSKEKSILEEARKLQIFFEEYDDDIEDVKYYRDTGLERRLSAKKLEEVSDEEDRQKEINEIENARQRLMQEENPDLEEIITKMEQSSVKHLQKKTVLVEDQTAEQHVEVESVPVCENEGSDQPMKEASDDVGDNNEGCIVEKKEASELEQAVGSNEDTQNKDVPEIAVDAETIKEEVTENPTVTQADQSMVDHVESMETDVSDRKLLMKNIIDSIPTNKAELFAYTIEWSIVDSVFVESRIKPWVKKKILAYIGEEESSLIQFICDQVLEHKTPEQFKTDIAVILDDEAEIFVMKMWRLLIYVIEEKKAGLDQA